MPLIVVERFFRPDWSMILSDRLKQSTKGRPARRPTPDFDV
jgi:hypothetical protein